MPEKTVLQLTQDVLSSINSDSVNSINDTAEALQVVDILETTYYELMSNQRWPHLQGLIQLDAATLARPTHMRMPANLQELMWVKYNRRVTGDTKDKYETITYLDPEIFIDKVMARDSSDADVDTVTGINNVDLLIINDTPPSYWTTFDDDYIVFDSYDSTVDTSLQQSKTLVSAYQEPSFTKSDTFVPDLPVKIFAKYIAEVLSTAWHELKQTTNSKQEQRSRRQTVYLSQNKRRIAGGLYYPSYGRRK